MPVTGNIRKTSLVGQTEYRSDLDRLHYSGLSMFEDNRVKFYKKYVLRQKQDEEKSTALIIGDLVDFYLTQDEVDFYNVFAETTVNVGSGQIFELTEKLFKLTKECLSEDGEITKPFMTLFEEAFNYTKHDVNGQVVKFKNKTVHQALAEFEEKARVYYKDLVDNVGKTVVSPFHVEKAKFIVRQLQEDDITADIINQKTTDQIEVHNQLNIFFDYNSIPFKCALDKVIIDHVNKIVWPFDLKTTYDNEMFGYGYLKNKYYLQNGVYFLGLTNWLNDRGLTNYIIKPMQFIVADTSSDNMRPIIYRTSEQNLEQSLNGFTYKGTKYRGVYSIADEIQWAKDNGIWNISKEASDNQGVLDIPVYE